MEDEENSLEKLDSLPLGPECIEVKLLSEHVDAREVRLEAMLSKSTPERRSELILSVLVLSEPAKDTSFSDSEISWNIRPLNPLPLENGDLLKTKNVEYFTTYWPQMR